jgi:peptide/nickel transport system substrate-binding protein
MNRFRPLPVAAAVAGVALLAGACTSSTTTTSRPHGSPVANGSLAIALPADPGNLDPQRSVDGPNLLLSVFAYDTPVKLLNSGKIAPEVVSAWQAGTKSYTLTVRSGVTCSDGSTLDAKVVADNINYVADTKNASPMAGVAVPVGARATASGDKVTVALQSDAPFFMQNLAELPLVCAKGLANRSVLAKTSDGSGPYVISSVTPGDHVDYTVRKGYTWGPNGASTATSGLPAKLTFRIVTSPTTTANLLLNGQLNVAQVSGADATRLKAGSLFSAGSQLINNELAFNESSGEAVADVAVRRALVASLNLPELARIDTGGMGKQATGLIADPKICSGNTMSGRTPAFDAAAAATMLDQAGWTKGSGGKRTKNGKSLRVKLIYTSSQPTNSATAQYIGAQWQRLGVAVQLSQVSFEQQSALEFSNKGEWSATLIGLGVSNPQTLVPFFSGPAPTKGNNFGHFDNKQYASLVTQASTKPGTEGCADWNAAEGALFTDADITPISTNPYLFWGKNASFDVFANVLLPTSLRVLKG